jgi:2-polyprenyl-3-methyl-5-hydroxy-6-metoxy-1,4-benzoquinol methylase
MMPALTARYDDVADTYGRGPDDVTSSRATAALLALTGPVRDQFALDLACGHGVIARALASGGAHVVGLDLSVNLIEVARSREADRPLGIRYTLGSAADDTVLRDERFDVVTCNFGLSDIDDLDGACRTVARLLAPGGRFIFSILHPCFAGAPGVSGSWPTGSTYYDERWWRADGELSTLRAQVGANHRMLSTYVRTLGTHGLVLDTLVEPEPEPAWTLDRPVAAAQPVYLVARCLTRPVS